MPRSWAAMVCVVEAVLGAGCVSAPETRRDRWDDDLPRHATARLGSLRWRQRAWADRIVFDATGGFLFNGGSREGLLVWEVATGRRRRTVSRSGADETLAIVEDSEGRTSVVSAAGASIRVEHVEPLGPGEILVIWNDGVIEVRDSGAERVLRTLPGWTTESADRWKPDRYSKDLTLGDLYGVFAVSPDGRTLAWGCGASSDMDGSVLVREMDSGQLLAKLEGESSVSALAMDPSGRLLAVGGFGGRVHLHEAVSGRRLWGREPAQRALGDFTSAVAFSPDGELLATGGSNGAILLWDVATGEPRGGPSGHDRDVTDLRFLPDGMLVSASSDGTIRTWDLGRTSELRRLEWDALLRARARRRYASHSDEPGPVRLALHPDGSTLASTGSEERWVRLWNLATGREIEGIREGHGVAVMALALSPDSKMLASGGSDGRVLLWDVGQQRIVRPLGVLDAPVSAIAFSGDGLRVVARPSAGEAAAWATPGGGSVPVDAGLEAAFDDVVRALPDGGYVVLHGGRIDVHANSGERVASLEADAVVESLSLSRDGRLLAAGCQSGTILIYDLDEAR